MSVHLDQGPSKPPAEKAHVDFLHRFDLSAILVVIGVIALFLTSIVTVMVAPMFIDKTWVSPSSPYQVQMYEVEDPNVYIGGTSGGGTLQHIHHIKDGFTLLGFKEGENERIVALGELDNYITRAEDSTLKLTSRLLLLRRPEGEASKKAELARKKLRDEWEENHVKWREEGLTAPTYQFLELYDPGVQEAFSYGETEGVLQHWVDTDFKLLEGSLKQPYHQDYGVVFVQNPREYRISAVKSNDAQFWRYDPDGRPVRNIEELSALGLDFRSRKELIAWGEHIYAIEGCWYCHTDQTRTLIQDTVLNGSDSYPAPPSSANEYIYQRITFPGTRRIGPDLSRVGVKRPGRDWHKGHFWAPKTASAGSVMPAFQHFFDADPRGTGKAIGIPNHQFEAIYQYLMTKGTRITAPTQAWWLGKDPIKTKEIIEGRRKLP
jgi:cytochrome c oxidase cbb3-type subunit 2